MIPQRRRAELPAGHQWVVDEDPDTGRPVVILADWIPQDRDVEQKLVRDALRWWRSTGRGRGLAAVPLAVGLGVAWAARHPGISAASAAIVTTAAALAAFVPGTGHHPVNPSPGARPPAASGQTHQSRPQAVPVSHKKSKHNGRPAHPGKRSPGSPGHKSHMPVLPVVGKIGHHTKSLVPPTPGGSIPQLPVNVPGKTPAGSAKCASKSLLGSYAIIGGLTICL